jgi:hypothetical protein
VSLGGDGLIVMMIWKVICTEKSERRISRNKVIASAFQQRKMVVQEEHRDGTANHEGFVVVAQDELRVALA